MTDILAMNARRKLEEENVLGLMLKGASPGVLDDAITLKVEFFDLDEHRDLFNIIAGLHRFGVEPDITAIMYRAIDLHYDWLKAPWLVQLILDAPVDYHHRYFDALRGREVAA